jgi:probable selenium-dependent hydroxylase accessory protein YqeC
MASLREGLGLEGGGVVSLVGAGGKTSLMFGLARELAGRGEPVLTTTTTKIMVPTLDQSPHLILSGSSDEIVGRAREILRDASHISAASGLIPAQDKLAGLAPEVIDQLWKARVCRWILVEADGAAKRPLKAPAAHEPVIPSCSRAVIGVIGLDVVGRPLGETWVLRPELYAGITHLVLGDQVTEGSIASLIVHPEGLMKGCPPHAERIVFLNKANDAGRLRSGRRIMGLLRTSPYTGLKRVVIGKVLYDPPVLESFELGTKPHWSGL